MSVHFEMFLSHLGRSLPATYHLPRKTLMHIREISNETYTALMPSYFFLFRNLFLGSVVYSYFLGFACVLSWFC